MTRKVYGACRCSLCRDGNAPLPELIEDGDHAWCADCGTRWRRYPPQALAYLWQAHLKEHRTGKAAGQDVSATHRP